VDRVEKLSEAGEAYPLRDMKVRGMAAFGCVHADARESRLAVVRAVLATEAALERSILFEEWRLSSEGSSSLITVSQMRRL
jgi:hypothetical protein